MNGMRIINPEAFEKALKQVRQGKFGHLDAKDFELPASDTVPIEGYIPTDNFPNCCTTHKQLYTNAKEMIENFPNCCEAHKKLNETEWFNKNNYLGIPEKIIKTVSYSEYHISKQIK